MAAEGSRTLLRSESRRMAVCAGAARCASNRPRVARDPGAIRQQSEEQRVSSSLLHLAPLHSLHLVVEGGGSENPIIVPSGARTYATSRPQGIRFGDVIGDAPSAIALANEAGTSRVRNAIGYQSRLSKHIRNLQFYNSVAPGEKGAIGNAGCGLTASPTAAGLIAGPTQDNGNLFCDLESPNNKAWRVFEGGDGLAMRFLPNGLLLTVSPSNRHASLSHWNGSAFDQLTEVPVTVPSGAALSVFGDVQAVTNPSFTLPDTQKLLFAVAATQNAGMS
jgi:hypothetical protein